MKETPISQQITKDKKVGKAGKERDDDQRT